MSNIKSIRERLGLTQAALAEGIGCTQGNVGHYERGQAVPPDAAKRLIDYAHSLGHVITFNDIYMPELANPTATEPPAEPAAAHHIPVDEPGALRAGVIRRHAKRRQQDAGVKAERRDVGPPFQSLETGVA